MDNKTKYKDHVILVDGSSYFYRAFHALPMLMTSKGQPTGAIYGVLNMLKKLLKEYNPQYMMVVFDAKGKTFREEIYQEYKANRKETPNELLCQFEPMIKVIEGLGFPIMIVDGVEADDVIGALAEFIVKNNHKVLISTGDKDLSQLVNKDVHLINTMIDHVLDEKGVEEKFGIGPELIVDYLALIGDPVDNVPGIPGVGPKTAVKWLKEYGTLDEIILHAQDIKGKVGGNLRDNISQLSISKKLVIIKKDVPLDITMNDLKISEQNTVALIPLFTELEMKNWLHEISKSTPQVIKQEKQYVIIQTIKELEQLVSELKGATIFAFDTETTGLDVINAKIVGISFSYREGEACYIPINHKDLSIIQLEEHTVFDKLQPIFADQTKIMIGHNIKFDLHILANYNIKVSCTLYDTMIEAYVLDSNDNRHNLDSLALKWLGEKIISFEEVIGSNKNQKTFDQINIIDASQYAAEDADVAFRLHQKIWGKLSETDKLTKICQHIDFPLISILTDLERNGVLIDQELLRKQSKEVGNKLIKLEEEIFSVVGFPFNLNSPKQLQEILYTKFNLPIIKKTQTGQPSTAEEVLQELSHEYELPKLILEYRGFNKLKSTYLDTLPLQVNAKTGRIHTSYNQAITATGRLSSTNPNLQNIPIRTEEGRKIRQAFIAKEKFKILSADYSQVELRIMAHLSEDQGLLQAFHTNVDVHTFTASEVFQVNLTDVTSEQRRKAKAINFGLIYGMSSFGLSKQLGISRDAAKEYINLYFKRYPKIKGYIEEIKEKAFQDGYVETLYGRKINLPEINSNNFQRQQAAERVAINAPIQGTAADLIKLAMINIYSEFKNVKLNACMIMQVHDELVFEVHERDLNALKTIVLDKMQNVAKLIVPLIVDIGIGDNWEEAH